VLNWVHVSEVAEKDDTPTLRSGISHHRDSILPNFKNNSSRRGSARGTISSSVSHQDLCDAKWSYYSVPTKSLRWPVCLIKHHGVTITVINALILHNERERAKRKEVIRHADFITDIIDSAKTLSDVMKAVSKNWKSLVITGKKTSPILQNAWSKAGADRYQCNCYSPG
jgi:hypothetical protein